ncbi:MAG: hypothetical protein QXN58_03990 [Saccharolobus sp.]
MEVKVVIGNNQVKIDDDNKTPSIIRGQNKYSIVRLYYYLTKGIYLLPRLYGIKATNPLEDWRNELEKQLVRILENELSLSHLHISGDFQIESKSLAIIGSVNGSKVSLKVELKDKPILEDNNVTRNLVKVDSFYFSSLVKKKPYILPAIRAGLIASFYKFLPVQFEGSPGIPKTLGIISEFINSMILPQGYRDKILEYEIYIRDNEIYCNEDIIYNANPEVLSLFSLSFYLKNSNENSIVVIEDPEVHLSDRGLTFLKELISSSKAKIVIASDRFE